MNAGELVSCLVQGARIISEQEIGHHVCMVCSCTAAGLVRGSQLLTGLPCQDADMSFFMA